MPKNKLAKSPIGPPTAHYLDISEVRDNCVIMKDGTLRAVLLCSSVNFSLKSEDEQNAIIQAYMGFLNSVDFPLQIVIQSRKLNIDGYLSTLEVLGKQQTNELLKVQITDYLDYVRELISLGDIMTKRFYIVVPYNPASDKRRSHWRKFLALFATAGLIKLTREQFTNYTESLERRVGFVISALGSMSLATVRLDTQGLIELYYNTYNPELHEQQKLVDVNKLQVQGAEGAFQSERPVT